MYIEDRSCNCRHRRWWCQMLNSACGESDSRDLHFMVNLRICLVTWFAHRIDHKRHLASPYHKHNHRTQHMYRGDIWWGHTLPPQPSMQPISTIRTKILSTEAEESPWWLETNQLTKIFYEISLWLCKRVSQVNSWRTGLVERGVRMMNACVCV